MAPTVKIDNPSSHNYSQLPGNASHYPVQMPNVLSNVYLQGPQLQRLPITLQLQQQHETTQKQGLTKENEDEIARQKQEMLSRYMKTIKEKKNLHLMSICIKTFELSVQNRKIQQELDELREQTRKFMAELKANSMTTNLKNPMSQDLSQQVFRTSPQSATNPTLTNIPNVNFLCSQNNPLHPQALPFSQSNFENVMHLQSSLDMKTNTHMMIPTTMTVPESTFPQNFSLQVEQQPQIMSEPQENQPSSIYRDGQIEKRILVPTIKEEQELQSVLQRYGICSNNASHRKDQNPSDNSNDSSSDDKDDDEMDDDSCSYSTSYTAVENCDILKRSVLICGEDTRTKSRMSSQLQQQQQNNMSKYLELISRKPTRRTRRRGSISSTSTGINLSISKKQNQRRLRTLSLRPSSSSSFSSCSDLNLSQCSSPVSPFFSPSDWNTNDEEEASDTDMRIAI